MFKTPYPTYDVLDKWASPSFDARTRGVLVQRTHVIPERRFFTPEEWALMEAVAARLVPQPDRDAPVPITPWIDQRLAENQGEGYRHEGMPPLQEAWRRGLAGVAAEAERRYVRPFAKLRPDLQDETLKAVQAGDVDRAAWGAMPPDTFFAEVLLKAVVGIYYAHPAAWSEIGFGGPASPRGYVRLGLDERDPWEAVEGEAAEGGGAHGR